MMLQTRPATTSSFSWRTAGSIVPLLIGGFPIWWALGLGEMIWPIAGLAMAWSLLKAGTVSAPMSHGLFIAFILTVIASGAMLEDQSDLLAWGIRLSQYISVGLIVPYALTFRNTIDERGLVRAASWLWLGVIGGGWLGLILGDTGFTSPFALILPASLEANDFAREVVNPSFADIETFLGYELRRPKAPFTFTNGWGAAVGLLAPFAVLEARHGIGISKRLARLSLFASVAPIIFSVNRGLWLSLVLVGAYGALIFAGRGYGRAVMQMMIAGVIVVVFVAVSPLGDIFVDRLNTGHSDAQRGSLVQDTIAEMPQSPLLGFGGPRQVNEGGPPLGSHGQVWIVLFSHGVLGIMTYFGYMISMFARTLKFTSEIGLWAHIVVFIGIVQTLFYGHVPQQLAIVMLAIAIALLDRHDPVSRRLAPT